MRIPNTGKLVIFYFLQFNLLFAVLFAVTLLFGGVSIPFWPWMMICNVIFIIVILPYLLYMHAKGH